MLGLRFKDLIHCPHECSKINEDYTEMLKQGDVRVLNFLPPDQILREILAHPEPFKKKDLFITIIRRIPNEDFNEICLTIYRFLLALGNKYFLTIFKQFRNHLDLSLIDTHYLDERENKIHAWFIIT